MLKKAFTLLALAVLPMFALAATVRVGDYFLKGAETVSDDLYTLGESVVFAGSVHGDALAAARTVQSEGTLRADALFVGETVLVGGVVADDVRVLGGTVRIRGKIAGDAVVVGAKIILEKDSVVSGNLYAVGGEIIIAGVVSGEVKTVGGSVRVSGSVGGTAEIWGEEIELLSGASVGSDFIYHASREATVATDAYIGGETLFDKQNGAAKGIWSSLASGFVSFQLLATLAGAFSLFLLFRERTEELLLDASENFWQRILRGLLFFLIAPFAGAFLFFTAVGIPLAFALLALYLAGLVFSASYAGMLLGTMLSRPLFRCSAFPLSARTVFVGVALLSFLQAVPYLGFAVLFLFTLASFGSIGTIGWRRLKQTP